MIARTDPASPCNAWYYSLIPGERLSPCYLPAESISYHIEEYGGVGLNECKFRVEPSAGTIWHINPSTNTWETTSGPGWTKVGIDLICGYGCETYESEDQAWMAVQPRVAPEEEPAADLSLSYGTTPEHVLVHENAKGAEPVGVKLTATVTNTGSTPVQNVKFEDPLKITPVAHTPHDTDVSGCTWATGSLVNPLTVETKGAAATSPPCPLSEASGPLDPIVGTLAPGASASVTYTLNVAGDGDYQIYTTVSGERETNTGNEHPVKATGSDHFQPDSQLLMFSAKLGAKVKSQENPLLVKAGTHFLIDVHLENRSYYRQVQVNPIEAVLEGNASDGQLVPANTPTTVKPAESLEQVENSPYLLLEPREQRNYEVVVNTAASDAFAQKQDIEAKNGTRAVVKFGSPTIETLEDEKNPQESDDEHVVMEPESSEFKVGIDESTPPPPPFSWKEATWSVGKGLVYGLWSATYGTVKGIFDLGMLALKGASSLATSTLNEVGYLAELWKATENEPAARLALMQTLVAKVEKTFAEAPALLEKTRSSLATTVEQASTAYFTKITNNWYAGDWREAVTEASEGATTGAVNVVLAAKGIAQIGAAAVKMSAGTISRLPVAAEALAAADDAKYAETATELADASKPVEPAEVAYKAVDNVPAGYRYSLGQLAKFFGVSPEEAAWLRNFTQENKISVVFRSRVEESINWLKEGAMLKPYWVKAKNVNWVDIQFLGYDQADLGRVVMREPPDFAEFEKTLDVQGVRNGSPEYTEAVERWQERSKNYVKELKEMEGWAKAGDIKGKWPWGENGVDPDVQADEEFDYKFRLTDDPHSAGAKVPEIFNPATGKWGSITGDIDLIAITKADGSALSDAEQVKYLIEMREGPLGTQHPESLTWEKDGKFWFDKKADYLNSKDLVESGPDGIMRAVRFNEELSEPTKWTKANYRIVWNGGYEAGTGQATSALAAPAGLGG